MAIFGGAVGGAIVAAPAPQDTVQIDQSAYAAGAKAGLAAAARAERAAKRAAASATTARTRMLAAGTEANTAEDEADDALAAAKRAEAAAKRAEALAIKVATRPCPDELPAVNGGCDPNRSPEAIQNECIRGNDYRLNPGKEEGECVDGVFVEFPAPPLQSRTYTRPDGTEGKECWIVREDGTNDYRPCP